MKSRFCNQSKLAATCALCCVLALLATTTGFAGPPDYTPKSPRLMALGYPASPQSVLDAFVGIPYRSDGAVDLAGRFVLFARPEVVFETPGLNCSGFALAAFRMLMGDPVSLERAKADRLGDSAKGAPLGEDWDFGWDFVCNLTAHRPGAVLISPHEMTPLADALQGLDGRELRGFDLGDAAAWRGALDQMRPGAIVLADFSKPWNKNGYTLLHHHVALILPLESGERWYYHAVGKNGVERIGLHTADGLADLLGRYPQSPLGARKILLVGVPLPR